MIDCITRDMDKYLSKLEKVVMLIAEGGGGEVLHYYNGGRVLVREG